MTLGIFVGYVLGKPLGIVGATWLAWRLSRRLVGEPLITEQRLPWRPLLLVSVSCLAALALLYSGFGRDLDGLARAYNVGWNWSRPGNTRTEPGACATAVIHSVWLSCQVTLVTKP